MKIVSKRNKEVPTFSNMKFEKRNKEVPTFLITKKQKENSMNFIKPSYGRRMPALEIFRVRKNFDRLGPETWFMFFALILVMVGALWFKILWVLVLIGGFVLFIYLIVGAVWIKSKL